MDQHCIIEAENISFAYNAGKNVIDNISLKIKRSIFYTIIGPNACGKTTLIKLFAKLIFPNSGKLHINWNNMFMIHQKSSLLPWYNVTKNISLPLEIQGYDKKIARSFAINTLENLGEIKIANNYPYELSAGLVRKIELARLFALKTDVWFLDEPFESLDLKNRMELSRMVSRSWLNQKTTVINITHNIDEAISLSNFIIVMSKKGKILNNLKIEHAETQELKLKNNQHIKEEILSIIRNL